MSVRLSEKQALELDGSDAESLVSGNNAVLKTATMKRPERVYSRRLQPSKAKQPKVLTHKEVKDCMHLYKDTTMFFYPFHFVLSNHHI